jgi:actin-related protein
VVTPVYNGISILQSTVTVVVSDQSLQWSLQSTMGFPLHQVVTPVYKGFPLLKRSQSVQTDPAVQTVCVCQVCLVPLTTNT